MKGDGGVARGLGSPSSSGALSEERYAFFGDKKRLLVEKDGKLSTYDSGDHKIQGVSQANGDGGSPSFTDQSGTVDVSALKKIG